MDEEGQMDDDGDDVPMDNRVLVLSNQRSKIIRFGHTILYFSKFPNSFTSVTLV